RLDREVQVGRGGVGLPDATDHGPARDLGADLERLQLHGLLIEREAWAECGLEGLVARDRSAEELVELAGSAAAGAVPGAGRQREEAVAELLGVLDRPRLALGGLRRGAVGDLVVAGGRGLGRGSVLVRVGELEVLRGKLVLARNRMDLGE